MIAETAGAEGCG